MNLLRRNFLKSVIVGVLSCLGFSKLSAGEKRIKYLKGIAATPVWNEVVLKDWRNGYSTEYVFGKGPDYTTAEEAYPEMEKVLPQEQVFENGQLSLYERFFVNERIVFLKSVNFYGKVS